MDFVEFSGGYFAADLRAEEYDDGPVIARQFYDYINHTVYEDANIRPWLTDGKRVGEPYFRVEAEAGMPSEVIGLPEEFMDDLDIEDDYELKMFLIVKPGFAAFLEKSAGLEERFEKDDATDV